MKVKTGNSEPLLIISNLQIGPSNFCGVNSNLGNTTSTKNVLKLFNKSENLESHTVHCVVVKKIEIKNDLKILSLQYYRRQ